VRPPRVWLAAALGALAGWTLGALGRRPRDGSGAADPSALRADLEAVRALLRQYMEQREAAEEQLRQSEERFRLLAENAGDIISLTDLQGRITYISPAVQGVIGYTPEEIADPALVLRTIHPEDLPATREYMRRAHAGEEQCVVYRARHRDGHWIWLSSTGRPVRNGAGEVTGIVGIARDITQWYEATVRLRESEAKYRMLAESIDDVVSLHDVDGTALYYSPSSTKLTGLTPAELVGTDSFYRTHPEDRPAMLDAFARALRGDASLVRWRCRRKDGSYVWVETRTSLVRDERGEPHRVLAVTRDIERRLRTEAALEESEQRYQSLITRAAYGIYRSTLDGRFLDVNPALVAMLGYDSTEELMAVNLATDVYADAGERDRLLALALDEALGNWVSVHWRRRDGTPILVRLSARVVRDEGAAVKYIEAIAEDITDRGRQEEMLRRSERMASLGHTLAGVAHELNNPLAAISGFAQLMLRGREWPEDDRVALQTIAHEAVRAGRIVKDLLTFSRRQEASQRHQRVNLNHVVRYIFDAQRYAMETRGIRSTVTLEPTLAPVVADAAQMEQVVLNLVVNARQALEALADAPAGAASPGGPPPVPRVTARTLQQGSEVVLEIADNGPGIAPGDLTHIWDPFWTTKGEGEGTGLGLSVVHGIVSAHGGTIGVESTPGAGTHFTIRLPAAPPSGAWGEGSVGSDPSGLDRPADDASAAPSEELAERPLDILLVDDEEAILTFLRRYLTSRGHAVMTAQDGEQALRIAEHSSFDVVVCDLRMPGMTGAEVIRRLRAFPGLAEARYVLSTGDRDLPESADEPAVLGVSMVVEKPYEIDVLRRAVEEG